jgi:hypothetical protein
VVSTREWPRYAATLAEALRVLQGFNGLLEDAAGEDQPFAPREGVLDNRGLADLHARTLAGLSELERQAWIKTRRRGVMSAPDPDEDEARQAYDDAELTAHQILRLAVAEDHGTPDGSSPFYEAVNAELQAYIADRGRVPLVLVVALARHAALVQIALLEKQLGHCPSPEEASAELDRLELGKLEIQQEPG